MGRAPEVPVLAGHPGEVLERREGGETDQEVPVLEERQRGIEGAGLGEEGALDQQGIERDVVVDQQDVGIEVAAVGEAALAADPAPLGVQPSI